MPSLREMVRLNEHTRGNTNEMNPINKKQISSNININNPCREMALVSNPVISKTAKISVDQKSANSLPSGAANLTSRAEVLTPLANKGVANLTSDSLVTQFPKTKGNTKFKNNPCSETLLVSNKVISKVAGVSVDQKSAEFSPSGAANLTSHAEVSTALANIGVANSTSDSSATQFPKTTGNTEFISSSKRFSSDAGSSATSANLPWRTSPSRRMFSRRRAAEKVMDRLRDKPLESLTCDDLASLLRAKQLLEGATETSVPDGPKRQRSNEETQTRSKQSANKRRNKRPKRERPISNLQDRSYSEIAKGNLVRAIVDRGDSNLSISSTRWGMVRSKLFRILRRVLESNPGPPPKCRDSGWFQGRIKLFACDDERSVTLLKQGIDLIDGLWEGAMLDVIPIEELPRRPRSTALIPLETPRDPEEILWFLQTGNPSLPTQDWKVVSVSDVKNKANKVTARSIKVIINQESVAPLRNARGRVSFAYEDIVLHVYKGDCKDINDGPNRKDKQTADRVSLPNYPRIDASQTTEGDTDIVSLKTDSGQETEREPNQVTKQISGQKPRGRSRYRKDPFSECDEKVCTELSREREPERGCAQIPIQVPDRISERKSDDDSDQDVDVTLVNSSLNDGDHSD